MANRKSKLYALLKKLTPKNCELLSFYESNSKKSYYSIIYKKPISFKVIRISDHKPYNRRFDVPTFIWESENDLPRLEKEIGAYIKDASAWTSVKYHEFVIMDYIWNRKRRNYTIHLDGEYYQGNVVVFYADIYSGSHVRRFSFSNRFSKGLKKFYGRGIINYYYEDENKLIKLTTLGVALYRTLKTVYAKYWRKDRRRLDFYQFELPEKNPPLPEIEESRKLKSDQKATEKVTKSKEVEQVPEEVTYDRWKKQAGLVWSEIKKFFKMTVELIKNIFQKDEDEEVEEIEETPVKEKPKPKKVIKRPTTSDIMKAQIKKRTKYSMDDVVSDDTMSKLSALKEQLEKEDKGDDKDD